MAALVVFDQCRRCCHHLLIEADDPFDSLYRYIEFHVGNTQRYGSELLIGLMAPDAIPPWTGRLNVRVALVKVETSAFEMSAHLGQALHECFPVRYYDADMAAQHLRFASGQVKLAAADINPHIDGTGHQERVTRQP